MMQQAARGFTRRYWGVLIAGESWMKFDWTNNEKSREPTLAFGVLLASAQATYQITIYWLHLGHNLVRYNYTRIQESMR